ncbi:MAG: hypothetical protein JF612_09100 [Planctomycetia bacterium]|nr:hypothetical protein [Planctomycetia bacterium]
MFQILELVMAAAIGRCWPLFYGLPQVLLGTMRIIIRNVPAKAWSW